MSKFTVKFDGKGHKLNSLSVTRTVKRIAAGNPGRVSMIQGDNSSALIMTQADISLEDQRKIAIVLGGSLKEATQNNTAPRAGSK